MYAAADRFSADSTAGILRIQRTFFILWVMHISPPAGQDHLRDIRECGRKHGLSLDLTGRGLKHLPAEIGQLDHLRQLHLGHNRLSSLPPEIGKLRELRVLVLDSNHLATLPSELGRLTNLRELYVRRNELTAVAPELSTLSALMALYLDQNKIVSLPSDIGRLSKLMILSLAHNNLTHLPASIGDLSDLAVFPISNNDLGSIPNEIGRLVNLTELSASRNRLRDLPSSLASLQRLRRLSVAENRLSELPRSICALRDLRILNINGNELTTIPPDIRNLADLAELSLEDNLLVSLPDELLQLRNLISLDLARNPTLGIPDSLLASRQETRPGDILRFYFAKRDGAATGTLRAVNEVKVVLVGRGGAGKTSLRRFFMNQPHNKNEGETPGIALDSFTVRTTSGGDVTARLWDFAGQEITHALHQFFLTEGCVYVLVLDPRSNTEMQDCEYWLGLLRRYAGGAPVLVALNKQDSRQGGYDVDRRVLRERFPFVRDFVPTNCERREGCSDLLGKLVDTIDSLKETEPPRLQVPRSWLTVMQVCAGESDQRSNRTISRVTYSSNDRRSERREHLTLEEFRTICHAAGETEPSMQESLARLLHKLGAVLHFVDEPRLRDTAVLNPHWVTDGVYRLLRYKDRPQSDGIISLTDALAALPGETPKAARFLLRLMERFEMCFPLLDEGGDDVPTRWLIPGSLGEFQPVNVTGEWQNASRVRLRYSYEPLPEGLLPRFIVMTYLLSERGPRWRNGVVLEDANAKALVRRGENRNQIEVIAVGPDEDRLRLLEIVQGTLERIHRDLPDPQPIAEVELLGRPGTFRSLADLEAAELGKQKLALASATGEPVLFDPATQLNQASDQGARGAKRAPLATLLTYSYADKRAKAIFQQNLAVMTQKRFVAQWQDDLIEPGTQWLEQIEGTWDTIDLFVGLLTTAFLASGFIERVDVRSARLRLRRENRDFLFVLILVDDISLDGLDLSEYHILKPSGMPVSKHPSRRRGFDTAQAELEALLLTWQLEKRRPAPDNLESKVRVPRSLDIESTTIFVQGDYVAGDVIVGEDNRVIIAGGVYNSQIGQILTNCQNLVEEQPAGRKKELLKALVDQVKPMVALLPPEKQDGAVGNLELAVKAVTAPISNRPWYDVSAAGLMEAFERVGKVGKDIASTLVSIGKLLWSDFDLPTK